MLSAAVDGAGSEEDDGDGGGATGSEMTATTAALRRAASGLRPDLDPDRGSEWGEGERVGNVG